MDKLNPNVTKFSESQPVLNAWQCETGAGQVHALIALYRIMEMDINE